MTGSKCVQSPTYLLTRCTHDDIIPLPLSTVNADNERHRSSKLNPPDSEYEHSLEPHPHTPVSAWLTHVSSQRSYVYSWYVLWKVVGA